MAFYFKANVITGGVVALTSLAILVALAIKGCRTKVYHWMAYILLATMTLVWTSQFAVLFFEN